MVWQSSSKQMNLRTFSKKNKSCSSHGISYGSGSTSGSPGLASSDCFVSLSVYNTVMKMSINIVCLFHSAQFNSLLAFIMCTYSVQSATRAEPDRFLYGLVSTRLVKRNSNNRLSFIFIVLIFDFKKLILVSESALCKGPFIYSKDGVKRAKMAVVNITLHYITLHYITL